MVRSLNAAFIAILLAFCSVVVNADTKAPEIIPEPAIPSVLKELSPLDFRAQDDSDLEPELIGYGLIDGYGAEIPGVSAEWGKRCPEGFVPSNKEGICTKTKLIPKSTACQDGFDLVQNSQSVDVCRRVDTIPANTVCPELYSLSSNGAMCELFESRPAGRECPAEWTMEGNECYRTLEEAPEISCPDGYDRSGSECSRVIEVPPADECPAGSEVIGNQCSTLVYSSANACPKGAVASDIYGGTSCAYDVGVKPAPSEFYPYKYVRCHPGYTRKGTSCHKLASYSCSKWGKVNWGGMVGATGRGCGTWNAKGPTCAAGLEIKGSMFGVTTCAAPNSNYVTCPAGYFHQYNGRCLSNTVYPAKTEEMKCMKDGWGLGYAEYGSGACWTLSSSFEAQCPSGYAKNIEDELTTGNYGNENACVSGGAVTRGGLCEEGFSFDGAGAVCAAVTKAPAEQNCPVGFNPKNNECKKVEEVKAEVSCPGGFERQDDSCVKISTVPASKCALGHPDESGNCFQRVEVQPKKEFSCPGSRIPQMCGMESGFGFKSWKANYDDEKLSVAQQEAACQSYTRDTPLYKFTPISENTYCSAAGEPSSGPGYHCVGSGTQYCRDVTDAKHRSSNEEYSTKISTTYSCPAGFSLSGGLCIKEDVVSVCPTGWAFENGQCAISTSIELNTICPAGYVADGEVCKYIEFEPFEYLCPAGQTLRGTTCFATNESGPYTGDGCPEGEVVFGGSCQKTEVEPPSQQCPSGYELTDNTCKKTTVDSASYTCGTDPTWSLQSTTCWRIVTEPSLTECPDGSWAQQEEECTRTVDDVVQRECPEGYDQSSADYSECVKTEIVDNIQGNRLTVTIPKVWPGSYTLSLSVRDAAGNIGSEDFDLNYAPDLLTLRGGEAKLSMPAVQHAFKWEDGAATLVTQPIEVDGNVLSDGRPVYAGVSSKSTTGYNFAGIDVEPGEYKEVVSDYDFAGANGSLELPMYPLLGEASSSDIVVSVGGNGEAATVIEVDAWVFTGEVKPSKNPIMQLFQELVIETGVAGATPCSLTGQALTATKATELKNPYCLIEWTDIPAPLHEEGSFPQLKGQFDYEGTKEAGFTAYLLDSEGTRIKVGEASASIEVKKAFGSFEWQFKNEVSPILHTVEELNGQLYQTAGPNCRLTMDEDRAIDYAQKGYVGRLCFLEWFDLPGTLEQAPHNSRPWLTGRVFNSGHYEFGYRVFAYTSLGVPVMISEQTAAIEAIDPPPPTVEVINAVKITDHLFESDITGDRLASAYIESKNADVTVIHTADNEVVDERRFQASPWNSVFATYQRLKSTATKLWERNRHTVMARYTDLPSIDASDTIETLSVPSDDIGPSLFSDAEYVLNDDTISLSVAMGNLYRSGVDYDASLMGEWEIRAVQQVSYGTYDPVTDWVDHDSQGRVTIPLDLEKLGVREGYVRVYAEARVKSPVSAFSRIKYSSRPVFLKVLYGGEINAEVDGRQMSGPVPFRGVFKLDLSDRGLFRALGDVQWQISKDDGATWIDKDNNARNNQYLDITFEEPGNYLVKAKLKNRNSTVATETSPVEVIAYRTPEVDVDWFGDVFIGEEVILDATVKMDGQEVTADEVDIEWSNDAGRTFEPGGLTRTFERASDPTKPRSERWVVRVKAPIAPAEDRGSWTEFDGSINYRTIRGPKLYIQGPRVLEIGETYKFNVYRGLPYSRMEYDIKGFFTMPDGSEVSGDTAMYTPTEADLGERYIKLHYTGWIEGWKDAGAINTDDQGVRIWEYQFPEFAINGRYSANVAPVEATLYARPRNRSGRLEDPVYEWDIPEGVEIVEAINPIARKVIIHEPGTYELKIKVTDRRLNEGGATETIVVGEPEPYELNMRLAGSNKYNRAPYEIIARPDIDGGHPRDSVMEYNYTVNGEPMDRMGRYGQAKLEAGEHTVRLEILSKFGLTGAVEETLTVYENRPPACKLEVRKGSSRYTVRNRCEDPDGYVSNFRWWIDGEPLILTGYRISIPQRENGKELLVEAQAIDSEGLVSEVEELRIQMPEPPPVEPDAEG